MKPSDSQLPLSDPIAQTAARWVLRHDRGLTAAEQDEFSQWLAADPRHATAWSAHRWGWDELDRLAGLQSSVHAVPDPDLLSPRRTWGRRMVPFASLALAAAAAVALGLYVWAPYRAAPAVPAGVPFAQRAIVRIEERTLPDGSIVRLNRGALVAEHFTAAERRVRLLRGEASFEVTKDAARPFVVEAGGVAVRAVGTVFNVRLDAASVEVVVTEGRVQVEPPASAAPASVPLVAAGERTVVSLAPAAPPPQIVAVPAAEMETRLAWQPRMLDFTAAPLGDIVAEFNRRNSVRLALGDTQLTRLRLSATFRSDNVEGFVRLMQSDFGMKAEWRGDSEIVLTAAK